MTFYNTIFKRSWEMTRKRPVLWLFGFFALFWGGKGMDAELLFSNVRLLSEPNSPFRPEFWQAEQWQMVYLYLPEPWLVVLCGVVVLCCGIVVLSLVMVSHIGLVDAFGTWARSRRKTPPLYTIASAIAATRNHFVKVTIINVLSRLLSLFLLGLVAIPLFTMNEGYLYSMVFFCTAIPFIIIISLLTKFAVNYVVLENQSVRQSIHKAWHLFSTNVGVSVELALLMVFGYSLLQIAATTIAAIFSFVLGMIIGPFVETIIPIGWFYVGVFAVLMSVGAVLFSTWHLGNWVLLFSELTKGAKRSKIHRVIYGE